MGFPKLQPTDVHYGSTGNAIFNWRSLAGEALTLLQHRQV